MCVVPPRVVAWICLPLIAAIAGCSSNHSGAQFRPSVLPSIWPTAHPARVISGGFGYRADPIAGDRRFHKGLDIQAPKLAPVVATAEGAVAFSGTNPTYGNYVMLDHGGGVQTVYAHLHERLVTAGKRVQRGETIGLIGMTGRATAPHVHYEVRVNGIPVDPRPYLTP